MLADHSNLDLTKRNFSFSTEDPLHTFAWNLIAHDLMLVLKKKQYFAPCNNTFAVRPHDVIGTSPIHFLSFYDKGSLFTSCHSWTVIYA